MTEQQPTPQQLQFWSEVVTKLPLIPRESRKCLSRIETSVEAMATPAVDSVEAQNSAILVSSYT